jgi:CheY-like chemotaxis protein
VSWGMQAEIAPSATAALDAMRVAALDRPFVLAIVDVMMPEVDGIELARIIKSDPKLTNTIVVFVSSGGPRTEFGARLHGLDFGAWLMKPVSQATLYDTLTRLLARADDLAPASQQSDRDLASERASLKPGAASRLKILVAEDSPVNQTLARLQLKKLGFEADFADNGIQALEAAIRFPYDVILMDCQMPEMDGYQATREIRRRLGSNRRVTIIAVTAHALSGDREKCFAAGMDGYLSKPVDIRALEAALALVSPSKSEENSAPAGASKTLEQPASNEITTAGKKEADRAPGGDAHSPPTSAEKTSPQDTCAGCAETIAEFPEEGAAPASSGDRERSIREGMNEVAIFDSEALLKRLMGDRPLARIVIAGFLEDFPSQLKQLRKRLAEADAPGARMQAHTLKGSAATVAAGSLCAIAVEMERLAEAGELDQFGKLLPRAVEQFERLKSALEHAGWL